MRVLVAPLDWGLGHATRCIPVIRACLAAGHEVELGTCGTVAALYRTAFPELVQHTLPSYAIRYPRLGFMMPVWLMRNLSRLVSVMEEEQEQVERIVKNRGIGLVISDNRFGCHSRTVRSIYMTHQLRIAFPFPFGFLESLGIRWHGDQARRFSEVWVPDIPDIPGLGGRLSHVPEFSLPVRYVGLLSRFDAPEGSVEKDIDVLGIISGPEPMRTLLQKRMLRILARMPGKHVVLLGTPGAALPARCPENVSLYAHLETDDFARMVARARHVLTRPGYSTVMDMARLGADCTFVPTPGQTEQVYLGKELHAAGYAALIPQKFLSKGTLRRALSGTHRIPEPPDSRSLLTAAVAQAC